jgi:hypothetical protein
MREGRRQATIAGIMMTTAAVAVFLAAPRYFGEPAFWLALVALPWVSRYLIVPIQVRKSQIFPIEADFRPFDPYGPDVPGPVADRFRRARADLEALGFTLRGHFRQARKQAVATGHVGLYEDVATGEAAKIIVVATSTRTSATLVMLAKNADGTELTTSDGAHLPNWPSPRWLIGQSFPAIRDAAALVEVHRARVARHGRAPVVALPSPDDGLLAHLRGTAARVWETPLGLGFYARDDASESYRPTWKGIYLMTWGRIWPVGPIRLALRRRRAARTLRELGLADRAIAAG